MKKIKEIFSIFKEILPKNINFKKIYVLACFYSVCEILSLLIFSYFGIDKAFKENNVSVFVITIISIMVVQLSSIFIYAYAFKSGNTLTRDINISTREKLFKKVMELDKEYHNNHATGATVNTLVGDVEIISEGFFWPSMYFVIHGVNIILSFIICMCVNFKLGLIILILGPVIFALSLLCFKKMSLIDDKRREARKRVLTHINDGVMGVKTIKSLNLEDRNNKEYYDVSNKLSQANMKKHYIGQLMWRSIDFINIIAIGVLFYLSYNQYITNELSYGSLYLFFLLFDKCLYSIAFLADNIESFSDVLVSAQKISGLLKREPLVKDREELNTSIKELKGKIEFLHTSFKYPKGEQILDDFNLVIKPKSKVALVGRTGSGKSTIASLIYRFYEPTRGKILFDDCDYLDLSQTLIRKQIGFILQESLLFDDTILENIRYGKREATIEEVEEVCKRIGLDSVIRNMKNGYETKVGEGGIILSNGQKQLIAFARVLLVNPSIVILDEATSSIDSSSELLIQNCIDNEFKDKTCVIIAHRLSTIRKADDIVYLDKGKIIEEGNHEQLMNKKDKYYKLYTNQFYSQLLEEEMN